MDHSSEDKDSQSDVGRQADGGGNEWEGLGFECYISLVLSTWAFMSAPLSSSLSILSLLSSLSARLSGVTSTLSDADKAEKFGFFMIAGRSSFSNVSVFFHTISQT